MSAIQPWAASDPGHIPIMKRDNPLTKALKKPDFITGMNKLSIFIVYHNNQDLTDYVTKPFEFFTEFLREQAGGSK